MEHFSSASRGEIVGSWQWIVGSEVIYDFSICDLRLRELSVEGWGVEG